MFIKKIIKKFILGAFILYSYNLIAVNFGLIVPINIFSLSGVSIFGTPGLIALVLFKALML